MAVKENNDKHLDDNLRDLEKEAKQGKADDSDCDPIENSVGSKADSLITNGEGFKLATEPIPTKNMKVHPSPSAAPSEVVDDKPNEDLEEVDLLAEDSSHSVSVMSDDERDNADEINEHDRAAMDKKIEEMETRIEKLEGELREVAALEISLYSVVPEHGSSAHKLHTPARRLCRLYIHACKHWTQDRRATVAKNTVSGLVMIAKSCGNDVPRLTFWLSNTIVLREIISQAFGNSSHSSPMVRLEESNGGGKRNEGKHSSLKWKVAPVNKQLKKPGFVPLIEDWQETRTFTAALEKVESWIFSRLVESVWWQTITPNMQSPAEDMNSNKSMGRLLGPSLGDQQQRSFSIDLWKKAFQDASQRLCPLRAGGHECGCLPVLGRSVMKQCITRLDVAMFNAILRESAHEIPTDPISDPILDSKVLPIPAGDLSFGSGAQLKNSIGYWTRWLTDMFGMDSVNSREQNQTSEENDNSGGESNSFHLLNALSDLLMLPKDMLIDKSIRKEVCPSIGLPLIKRILCNFTPDEFCPDAVPGAVLEALNAESIMERRLSGDSTNSFPCPAAPVVYVPPSTTDIAEKIAEAGARAPMERSASIVQKKGYTSDEELEELNSPPFCFVEKSPSPSTSITKRYGAHTEHSSPTNGANSRYELLREVWSA